jgi:hypothetical protein
MKNLNVKPAERIEAERAAILAKCLATNPLARAALAEIMRARMAPAIPSNPGARGSAFGKKQVMRRAAKDITLSAALSSWR